MAIVLNIDERVFNKVYRKCLNKKQRTQIFFGGSSSGKSYFLAQRTIIDVLYGRNFLICRQVQSSMRKSVWNEILKAISRMQLSQYFKINKAEFSITCLLNGRQILFSGLDDAEKIKSITPASGVITDIWIEEATDTKKASFNVLKTRLRGRQCDQYGNEIGKRIILSFNPVSQSHWIYKDFFGQWNDEKNELETDDLYILKTTYLDNEHVGSDTKEFIESFKEIDPYYYDVYALGNWGVIGNIIFKNWHKADLDEIYRQFRDGDCLLYGLDFGWSPHPFAFVVCGIDFQRRKIFVFKEIYKKLQTNEEIANEIMEEMGPHDYVTCDSSDPQNVHELSLYGVDAIPANKRQGSVLFGINWLRRFEIIVDVDCRHMSHELEIYCWKEDRQGNVLQQPVKENDHLIDALRYALNEFIVEKDMKIVEDVDDISQ